MVTNRIFKFFPRKMIASPAITVLVLCLVVVCIITIVPPQCTKNCCSGEDSIMQKGICENKHLSGESDEIHLSVVACGNKDRVEETLIMLKSAVLFAHKNVTVHLFADNELKELFRKQLKTWPDFALNKLTYNLYSIQYPHGNGIGSEEWRQLFQPCASLRLFIPNILNNVEKILYVDTDILFLRPIDDVWRHFSQFNDTHIAGLSPEHEEPSTGWYNRFARHPYFGSLGVNSGVLLMNLTRMRAIDWVNIMTAYYKEYKSKITWGDQDLINIFFHYHPEMLYVFDCSWNYRPDHCMFTSNCKQAEEHGVSVLHGNRRYFQLDEQPAFKVIHQSFHKASFEVNGTQTSLIKHIDDSFKKKEVGESTCGRVYELLTKILRQTARVNDSVSIKI